jgi:Tol biopolymer transport system component
MKTISTVVVAVALAVALAGSAAAPAQSGNELFQKALVKERSEGELTEAIKLYQTILQKYGKDRKLAARALLQLGRCHERLGQADARKAYERVVRDYGEQAEQVQDARAGLAALAAAGSLSRPPAITLRRVWAGPEAETPGFPSPDGRYFTFTGASGNMVVRDLATGESRRLTQDSSSEWQGEWWGVISPDGKQVAYSRGTQLRVVGFDGSNVRTLVRGDKETPEVYAQGWSPDQKHILAVIYKSDRTDQIVFVSVADGAIRVLKSLPPRTKATSISTAIRASLSPDGRYIVYDFLSREDCQEHDIFLLSADGSIDRPLIQHPADDWRPAWTPDGTRILFASNRDGNWGFWTIAVSGGKLDGTAVLLKPDIGDLRMSSGFDGQGRYYYFVEAGREDVYVAEMDPNSGMFTAQPVSVPSRFVGRNSIPTWSPDGEYLAYLSHRGRDALYQRGRLVIVIRSVRTGEERDLATNLNPMMAHVRWFPDGRSLLVGGYEGTLRDGTETLYRVDVQSGAARAIRQIRRNALDPTLSPDGRVVYYWQMQDEAPRLIAHQIESGEERELYTATGSWRAALAVSPDGRQLGIAHADGKSDATVLKVMPAAGGNARVLLQTEPNANIVYGSRLEWTRDGRYLVVARLTQKAQNPHTDATELWRVPVEGGEPQRIGPRMERIRFPSVHPDGRRIAFDSGTSRPRRLEVWAMENFLPALKAPVRD